MKCKISEYLQKRQLTQRELADAIGSTEVSISRYVNGERIPKTTTCILIAKALDCKVEDLYCKTENMTSFNEKKDNRWIPCSERLPEESLNSVIGWDEYRKRCVFIQYVQGKFQNMGTDDSFNITAWRPLPEPYKEEDEKSDRTGSNK